MKWSRTPVPGVLLAIMAAPAGGVAQETPIDAVSTIGMIADVVANVGGDCVAVVSLMGPGVDPHLYQATARDVQTLQNADVIFYSGYSLEGQLGEVLGRFAETKPTVAVAPSSIAPADLIAVQDLYGIDPHVWMDVSLWSRTIPTIAGKLTELHPGCGDHIASNAEFYTAQLAELDRWVEAAVATIPPDHRILVTAHDAFSYYGRAYGIEVAGIQGISTESEAGVADIREMAELIAVRQVPAVFIESTINPRTIQAVVDATAHGGHAVSIGGQLYSDAMGQAGTPGGTYIGMMHENTMNIVLALGGQLPELPKALADWAEEWNIDP